MASFIYKCMRVKNRYKILSSRCNKNIGKNGILCEACYEESKEKPIDILMHHEVSKQFNIPFKNQTYVTICLNKKPTKPDSKTSNLAKEKDIKDKMFIQLNDIKLDQLKIFHDDLDLNIWNQKEINENEYKFRYYLTKEIINALIS